MISVIYREFRGHTSIYEVKYSIYGDDELYLGLIEGKVNELGELNFVIRIEVAHQKKGIGKLAFYKIFNDLNEIQSINSIVGNWMEEEEFQDLENGKSTNLSIFLSYKENGNTNEESAFVTPTGKWSNSLGFTLCKFEIINSATVKVLFSRP